MKVSVKGRSEPMTLSQITADNIESYQGVLSNPWIGAWVVTDQQGYVRNYGMKETIERLYEPAPRRFKAEPGWIDREPEEIKTR